MLNKLILLPISLVFLFFSCKPEKGKVVEGEESNNYDVSWIVGKWIDSVTYKRNNQIYTEEWEELSKNEYKGKRYTVTKGDTGVVTPVLIKKVEQDYFYSFDGGTEKFLYVGDSIGENYLGFSNTKDAYPHNLTFFRKSDSMITIISGMDRNGYIRKSVIKTIKSN